MYTKEYLNQLYVEEKNNIRKNSINNVVDYMKNLVIENSKKGVFYCKEIFPNEINEIKDDIMKNLKLLFPDSKIDIEENEYLNHYPRSINISINWE